MFPRSFRARLIWFFVIIVIVPMVAVSVVLLRVMSDSEEGRSDAKLAQAQTTAGGLYRGDFIEEIPVAAAPLWVAVFLFASAAEALVLPDTIEDGVDIAIGVALMGAPWIFEFREQAGPSLSFLATGFVVTVCAIADLGRDMREEAVRHRAAHG